MAAIHLKKVSSNLQGFALQSFLSDIKLVVNGKRYPAHKVVLAAASDYFKSMFSSKMVESEQDVITLKEIDTSAFEVCFRYMYSGEVELSEFKLGDVLFATSLFQLWALQSTCFDFMEDKMSPDNCFELYDFAVLYSNQKFQDAFVDFIRASATEITSIPSRYLSLSFTNFHLILKQDELNIPSDRVLYDALTKWVIHDEIERKKYFCELLQLVRLPVIPEKYLSFTVSENKHFTACNFCSDYLVKSLRFQLSKNSAGLTIDQTTWRGIVKVLHYGVENPLKVPDSCLTASGHNGNGWQASNGRLNKLNSNGSNGGWLQNGNYSTDKWIQVDLKLADTLISGVITQGSAVLNRGSQPTQFVKTYRIAYSNLGVGFQFIKDDKGKDKLFDGNKAENASVTNTFDDPITCRFFRIYPHSWSNDPVLRFELLTIHYGE